MKRKMMIMLLCVILLLSLWGCSGKETPAPETVAAQTEATTVPTEPVPTEPEEVKELVVEERYQILIEENSTYYNCALVLYPNSNFSRFEQNTYSVDGERITIDIEGEQCTFRKTENSLVLESGKLFARKGDESVEVPLGTETRHKEEYKLRDGIYVLDMSEYDFTFDEVLMDIDLTEMTFTLCCFDGNVVSGSLGFEEDKLVCTHEGGKMLFGISDTITENERALSLHSTTVSYATGGSVVTDQLMLCPQTDASLQYTFVYAEDREEEIVADPKVVPLDSYKHLYNEAFSFQERIPGKDDPAKYDPCMLFIRNYPLAGKWEFQSHTKSNYGSAEVTALENPDGSIIFSQGGKQWNFHREEDSIVFDGGSPLIAGNWNGIQEREYLEMEVPIGTEFRTFGNHYVYDALYILPGKTLEECYAAIQLDTKNQYVKIQCYDGKVLRGPFTYGDEYCNYIIFTCEVPDYTGMGTRTVQIDLMPNNHALCIRNPWMMSICPDGLSESNYFYLFPVQGVTPQEIIEE